METVEIRTNDDIDRYMAERRQALTEDYRRRRQDLEEWYQEELMGIREAGLGMAKLLFTISSSPQKEGDLTIKLQPVHSIWFPSPVWLRFQFWRAFGYVWWLAENRLCVMEDKSQS
ncbi:MAG: hypothetical protein FOGNACKC_00951 [Anaerolineae bacterium]|nr:hypothetical protein [Anaerolineae bacterium]